MMAPPPHRIRSANSATFKRYIIAITEKRYNCKIIKNFHITKQTASQMFKSSPMHKLEKCRTKLQKIWNPWGLETYQTITRIKEVNPHYHVQQDPTIYKQAVAWNHNHQNWETERRRCITVRIISVQVFSKKKKNGIECSGTAIGQVLFPETSRIIYTFDAYMCLDDRL